LSVPSPPCGTLVTARLLHPRSGRVALPVRLAFLVFHDEDVEIYVNGVLAASAPGYVGDDVTLPMNAAGRAALKRGENLIAVHCHQTVGGQYIDVGITRQAP
jgi:hypothetical protein